MPKAYSIQGMQKDADMPYMQGTHDAAFPKP